MRTIDDKGYEHREKRAGSIVCRCGRRVKLFVETEAWQQCKDRHRLPLKWRHYEYGCPHGFCECGFAYHGMPNGRMARIDCRP